MQRDKTNVAGNFAMAAAYVLMSAVGGDALLDNWSIVAGGGRMLLLFGEAFLVGMAIAYLRRTWLAAGLVSGPRPKTTTS